MEVRYYQVDVGRIRRTDGAELEANSVTSHHCARREREIGGSCLRNFINLAELKWTKFEFNLTVQMGG